MTIPALTKPVDELTAEDIQELVDRAVQEGENVEFKRGLSSSGESHSPQASTTITENDKRSLVKEIIAFANSYGGRLFLGIEEGDDEPPSAKEIIPIPDCADLAERLSRSCGDSIDPPMLRLNVNGVRTQDDGSGIIVFDVPRSIRAPHMSKRDNRAYRRRGSESVPMDMRDIQDMTLRLASRHSEIEAEFGRRKTSFDAWTKNFQLENEEGGYCLRLSFVPLDDVDIGRVHFKPDVAPQFINMQGYLKQETQASVQLFSPESFRQFRPVVRGTCLSEKFSPIGVWFDAYVWENGGLEIWFGNSNKFGSNLVLFSPWLGNFFANGFRNVERIRRYADLPLLSYGLETQLTVYGGPMILREFGDNYFSGYEAQLPVGEHVMPRSEVGSVDCFDGLITQNFTDWFNLAGKEWDTEISVDYRLD